MTDSSTPKDLEQVEEKPKRTYTRRKTATAKKEEQTAEAQVDKPVRKTRVSRSKAAATESAAQEKAPAKTKAAASKVAADKAADKPEQPAEEKPKRKYTRRKAAEPKAEDAKAEDAKAKAADNKAADADNKDAKDASDNKSQDKQDKQDKQAQDKSQDKRRRNYSSRDSQRSNQDRSNRQSSRRSNSQRNDRSRNDRRRRNTHEPISPKVTREDLESLKVVELKAKAEELGIDIKPLKRKAELIDAIYKHSAEEEGFARIKGILDILPEGYGFIRTQGYLPTENDIYVAAAAIRRNGLRKGDYIEGIMRPIQGNEKYPAINRVLTINGHEPEEIRNRPRFVDLTPIYPDERLVQEHGKNSFTGRCIDLVAPIGKGQRGLIVSPPKAGKTTILKKIAESVSINNPEVHLICLLVDERPEEVTDMQRSIKGEVVASTFDMPSEQHIAVSELVIERAKRLVEVGEDVVILLDSITRLARAYNLAQPASGRILSGGVDSTALYPPKRFLGAARNIENGGSLTILASALIDTGSKMDEVIFEEFKGTGNMELKLDRDLADRRIYPAIDPVASGTRKEDLLYSPTQLPFIWGIRRILANMNNVERAMTMLIKSLNQTESNEEFLLRSAKKAQDQAAQSIEI